MVHVISIYILHKYIHSRGFISLASMGSGLLNAETYCLCQFCNFVDIRPK